MIFAGWVPIRRVILEHTMDGRLSTTEYAVFNVLVLLADRHTGSGRINAPALRTYLPGLKYETAKRTLTSLQKKGYIWRSIKPRSTAVYLYWINHYEITDGPRRMFQTNLSQVFATGDISTITYDKHVPESTPHNTPEDTPQKPHYNDKDNNKDIDNDVPVIANLPNAPSIHSEILNEETGSKDCQSDSAISFVLPTAPSSAKVLSDAPPSSGTGLCYAEETGFTDSITAERVLPEEVNRRIAHLGLTFTRGGFYNLRTGSSILTRDAVRRITGASPEERRKAA